MNTPFSEGLLGTPRRRRLAGWVLLAVVVVGTPLFYLIENWRGERAWEAEKLRLQAAGISLSPADHLAVTADVPDDQNVAAASPYREACLPRWYASGSPFVFHGDFWGAPDNRCTPAAGIGPDFERILVRFGKGTPDGSSTIDAMKGASLLSYLTKYDVELAELRTAAARPQASFPMGWDKSLVEYPAHLELCEGIAEMLCLRSLALVATGDASGALVDWKLLMRQTRIVRAPFFLCASCGKRRSGGFVPTSMVWT